MLRNSQSLEQIQLPMDEIDQAPNLSTTRFLNIISFSLAGLFNTLHATPYLCCTYYDLISCILLLKMSITYSIHIVYTT
jgi:hypothetical protein